MLVCASFHSEAGYACMNHGEGLGLPPWLHTDTNTDAKRSLPGTISHMRETKLKRAVKIKAQSMLRAKLNSPQELKVSYSFPGDYKEYKTRLSIDFGLGNGLDLDEQSVTLDGKTGEHTFVLQTRKSGSYRLRLTARDLTDQKLRPGFKTVFVNVYDE